MTYEQRLSHTCYYIRTHLETFAILLAVFYRLLHTPNGLELESFVINEHVCQLLSFFTHERIWKILSVMNVSGRCDAKNKAPRAILFKKDNLRKQKQVSYIYGDSMLKGMKLGFRNIPRFMPFSTLSHKSATATLLFTF